MEKEGGILIRRIVSWVEDNVNCDCPASSSVLEGQHKMVAIVTKCMQFTNPRVFALEYRKKGSRIFFCTSDIHFGHVFMQIRSCPEFMEYGTWHEILLADKPVKLFSDMEFFKQFNPEINGQKMVDSFIFLVNEYLLKEEYIKVGDECNWVELDATTPEKFSRHLILNCEALAFSLTELSRIIHSVVNANKKLFTINAKPNEKGDGSTLFVDLEVYSKNQNFRMFGSPKFGRDNTLRLMKNGDHEFKFSHHDCDYCMKTLYSALVTSTIMPSEDSKMCQRFISMLKDCSCENCEYEMMHAIDAVYIACDELKDCTVGHESAALLVSLIHKHLADFKTYLGLRQLPFDISQRFIGAIKNIHNISADLNDEMNSSTLCRRELCMILEILQTAQNHGSQCLQAISTADSKTCELPVAVTKQINKIKTTLINRDNSTISKGVIKKYETGRRAIPLEFREHLPADLTEQSRVEILKYVESMNNDIRNERTKQHLQDNLRQIEPVAKQLAYHLEYCRHVQFISPLSNILLKCLVRCLVHRWETHLPSKFSDSQAFEACFDNFIATKMANHESLRAMIGDFIVNIEREKEI